MGAPLILGHDLQDFAPPGDPDRMSQAEFMAVVGNAEVIAVNQDLATVQGGNVTAVDAAAGAEVWSKPLTGGGVGIFTELPLFT